MAVSEANPSHALGHLAASREWPQSLSREELSEDLPGVLSELEAVEHRAALSTRHTQEGFPAGPTRLRTFLLRGKKTLWCLGCLPSSVTLATEAQSPAKGPGGRGKALGFLLLIAIALNYNTKSTLNVIICNKEAIGRGTVFFSQTLFKNKYSPIMWFIPLFPLTVNRIVLD